ncbi:MAG: thiamine diphosphokinase [Coriobacteriaceae bacterium]|jgi:thiamine pyrophosphokinase|nr:thiamine diphosphokinase [Coriobacteriaceae bacterium]
MSVFALVGAAEFNQAHFRLQAFGKVIAVDGGYRHLQGIGVVPDLVLGDFDSLGFVPAHPAVIRFPEQKDKTDIELALDEAFNEGCQTALLYGCLGGRPDLAYAVYQLLVRFSKAGMRVFAIGKETVVTALSEGRCASLGFSDKARGKVSVFSASTQTSGLDLVGLEYPLADARLSYDCPLGVSNSFTGSAARIVLGQGTALVFFPLEAWDAMEPVTDAPS